VPALRVRTDKRAGWVALKLKDSGPKYSQHAPFRAPSVTCLRDRIGVGLGNAFQ